MQSFCQHQDSASNGRGPCRSRSQITSSYEYASCCQLISPRRVAPLRIGFSRLPVLDLSIRRLPNFADELAGNADVSIVRKDTIGLVHL